MPAEFEIKCAENGEFYWVFKSGNGEVVATSQTYNSKQGCQKGIDSIRKDSSTAKIHDLTKS